MPLSLECFHVGHPSAIIWCTHYCRQGQSTDAPPGMALSFMMLPKNRVQGASVPFLGRIRVNRPRDPAGVPMTSSPTPILKPWPISSSESSHRANRRTLQSSETRFLPQWPILGCTIPIEGACDAGHGPLSSHWLGREVRSLQVCQQIRYSQGKTRSGRSRQ